LIVGDHTVGINVVCFAQVLFELFPGFGTDNLCAAFVVFDILALGICNKQSAELIFFKSNKIKVAGEEGVTVG
jgi:hypothetical protein